MFHWKNLPATFLTIENRVQTENSNISQLGLFSLGTAAFISVFILIRENKELSDAVFYLVGGLAGRRPP